MRLQNKVAVITGGARGLGAAMAVRFAKEGAKVIAYDMSPLSYQEEGIEGAILNVTDSAACEKFCREAIEKYGRKEW